MKDKIVLVGFMGSGKTTVGKLLSKVLKIPFVDLDEEIVKRTNMSIPCIFEKFGEERFREIERKTLVEFLLKPKNLVISTGGGAPTYKNNMELINKNSVSVYLKTDFEKLWERISKDSNRPLVRLGKEKVRDLLKRRLSHYEKAKIIIRTDELTPEEVVKKILPEVS
ncbi:Shikimate kinase [Desulfurobacterium thermolithotrophum DSM 11699]|uniref:Shikimate kinase n=1 Tax=Desulfurobacterium thermolithotrophum (strain DSM 11699 / BSA) TaxID=868864 RepID=F0S016_DESTD|nr:shikimate kinase [Desulfurobacterium thermolithotrophum]ADY73697.1 Shikimate kinase [Desulfurobacterium thermolithotrophum DSM 11699]